jgi:integrase
MPRESKPYRHKGYYATRINGRYYHLGKDRVKAWRKYYRLMAEAGRSTFVGRPASLAGCIERWLILHPGRDNEFRLRDFLAFAGRKMLGELDTDLLENYARYLAEQRGLAPKTVIDRVNVAVRVLRYAAHADRRWIRAVPDRPKLSKPAKKRRDVAPEQLAGVFASLPNRGRAARLYRILRFILETGCRPSEARALRWEWLRLDEGTATIPQHKTARYGKGRTLYLTPAATDVLLSIPDKRDTGYVFLSGCGKPYTAAGLRSPLRRRGLSGPYQLRHTFGQNGSEKMTIQDLARLMGHSDLKTTAMYFEVSDQRARQLAGQAASILPSAPPPAVLKLHHGRRKAGIARKSGKQVS